MKIAISLVLVLLVLYGILCALIYTQQEALIFHPTKFASDTPYTFSLPYAETNLPVDGAVINLVTFPAQNRRGVILYLHGNADVIPRMEWVAQAFVSLGYDAVMPDYRGYGKSSGTIRNEAELHADMEAVYQQVQATYGEAALTLYGQSLGSGLAAHLAANHHPARLILESPYYSVSDLAATYMPWVPRFLLKYPLRTDLQLAKVTCPVYLIHGMRDTVIPYDSSERLYRLIEGQKEFLTVEGAGHNLMVGNEQVQEFLKRILS